MIDNQPCAGLSEPRQTTGATRSDQEKRGVRSDVRFDPPAGVERRASGLRRRRRVQFGVGISTRSITRTSDGPVRDSSTNPSCSRKAVNISGKFDSGLGRPVEAGTNFTSHSKFPAKTGHVNDESIGLSLNTPNQLRNRACSPNNVPVPIEWIRSAPALPTGVSRLDGLSLTDHLQKLFAIVL